MKKTLRMMALMAMAAGLVLASCQKEDNSGTASGSNNGGGTPAPEGAETLTLTAEGVDFTLVRVEPGTFRMGANEGDDQANDREKPAHQVTLTQPYYIATTEVTQELYAAVMGGNPSCFGGDVKLPVERVSYDDALAFCEQLSELTGRTVTLPTEAQWEYAARGGHKASATPTLYAGGDDIDAVAWWSGNSNSKTHPVAGKSANALGLYDMTGNVFEWCLDWYGTYTADAVSDPQGPSTGSYRVSRGGSWYDGAQYDGAQFCRLSNRTYGPPDDGTYDLGFRVVVLP